MRQKLNYFIRNLKSLDAATDISMKGRLCLLLTSQITSKGILWDNRAKTYQMTPPDDVAAKIRTRLGPSASDDQVRQVYVHMQYNALTKKAQPNG